MARYIDANELNKFPIRLHNYDKKHGNEHFVLGIESVLEFAEHIPIADVVEVVRCKDCEYFYKDGNIKVCKHWNCHSTTDDAYCSYAKIKVCSEK